MDLAGSLELTHAFFSLLFICFFFQLPREDIFFFKNSFLWYSYFFFIFILIQLSYSYLIFILLTNKIIEIF